MTLHQLIQTALADTLGPTLAGFRPELALCATIVVLLLGRMLLPRWKEGPFWITAAGAAAALWLAKPWVDLTGGMQRAEPLFTGMLLHDTFSVYLRSLLFFFLILFVLFTRSSGIPRDTHATEFFVLILGAVLGMCLMVSANHMLIVFLGIEMASVPSYVLAGMLRNERKGAEAALKYAVYGAGTAGIMLYGISLLAGSLGSLHFPTMASAVVQLFASDAASSRYLVLILGGLMLMIGLGFKLSAVPFHFWAPDVFEGATAEVAGFLSIASKAAALGLLTRLVIAFGYTPNPAGMAQLEPIRQYMTLMIGAAAAVTCTFGNLAAYGQTNLKRLLAYSTIAHAGYLMMPVAAVSALLGTSLADARTAAGSMLFYLAVYVFMNLGAFAAVAFVRNQSGSEDVDALSGLIRTSTGLAVCVAIVFFSLVGLPPLAGFAAKFAAFASVYQAGLLSLLVVGLANTVLSLFYYLRVVKVMTLAEPSPARPALVIPLNSTAGLVCLLCTAPLLVWGIWWNGLHSWAEAAASLLCSG